MSCDITKYILALSPWDVIWPYDSFIIPPKWKMWVCLSKEKLWFLRINSNSYDENCVLLSKEKHPWLQQDRFMRRGGELVNPLSGNNLMENLEKQEIPERQGILGSIHENSRSAICAAIGRSDYLTQVQLETIVKGSVANLLLPPRHSPALPYSLFLNGRSVSETRKNQRYPAREMTIGR